MIFNSRKGNLNLICESNKNMKLLFTTREKWVVVENPKTSRSKKFKIEKVLVMKDAENMVGNCMGVSILYF